MASPYGPALGTPSFGAAAAAHGTPMTGGRFQTDDAFGRDSRFERGFGSGSNPGAFGGDAFPGARAAVRDRDLRTSAAPDYAPLLFGASPGPVGGPSPRARGLRARHRRVRRRVAAHARARGAAHAGVLRGGERPGRARRRPSGHRGKENLRRRVRAGERRDRRGRERRFRARALTSLTAAQRYEPRGIRGDGTPAGHVSTPWADRSSRREQRRGGSGDGAFDAWDDDADADVPNAISEIGKDERWVVVYGFDPDRELNAVLLEFQKDGDVEAHVAPRDEADANFAYVRFADAALRAACAAPERATGGRAHGGRRAAGRAVAREAARHVRRRGAGATRASGRRLEFESRSAYAGRIRFAPDNTRARGRRGGAVLAAALLAPDARRRGAPAAARVLGQGH